MANHWTRKETNALRDCIGSYGWGKLGRVAGFSYENGLVHNRTRSKAAIIKKAYRSGIKGVKRGAYSLHGLAMYTGYSKSALRRAQAALNQKWRRMGPKGTYIITEEQVEDIVSWLTRDYWNKPKRLYGCVVCGDDDKASYAGLGLCKLCYSRYRADCKKLKLPCTLAQQVDLVESLDTRSAQQGAILDRLHSGVALAKPQLCWLGKAVESQK